MASTTCLSVAQGVYIVEYKFSRMFGFNSLAVYLLLPYCFINQLQMLLVKNQDLVRQLKSITIEILFLPQSNNPLLYKLLNIW